MINEVPSFTLLLTERLPVAIQNPIRIKPSHIAKIQLKHFEVYKQNCQLFSPINLLFFLLIILCKTLFGSDEFLRKTVREWMIFSLELKLLKYYDI